MEIFIGIAAGALIVSTAFLVVHIYRWHKEYEDITTHIRKDDIPDIVHGDTERLAPEDWVLTHLTMRQLKYYINREIDKREQDKEV